MLANVDALGHAVPTARFMGGREYEAIVGPGDGPDVPTHDALASILQRRAFALPPEYAASERSGFAGRLIRTEGLEREERAALATAYLALRTDRRLSDLGATGDILIDGPLSANRLYVELLANLRPGSPIRLNDARSGVVRASLSLAGMRPQAEEYFNFALSNSRLRFQAYTSEWTDLAYPSHLNRGADLRVRAVRRQSSVVMAAVVSARAHARAVGRRSAVRRSGSRASP